MAQPNNRGARIAKPGQLDKRLDEFWVDNPWDIPSMGFNLSAFERNRVYLNLEGKNFVDVSHISGADSDGDGRAAVSGDFRNVGQMDVLVRQVGGGPFLYYENQLPKSHYLKVTLRGTKSNRLGIGARLVATVNGRQIVRENYPLNSFLSQAPALVYFGLGQDDHIDHLQITWPSGEQQDLVNITGDCQIVVTEGLTGGEAIEVVTPGTTIKP